MRISDWSSDVCSSDLGKRILLAWNGSREAARAAHDALPFLKKAEAVTVFSASPHEGQHALGADIAAHLGRHGVNATTANTTADDIAIGDVLLRSEEHTSELQSLMRISYAVFCLKKKRRQHHT